MIFTWCTYACKQCWVCYKSGARTQSTVYDHRRQEALRRVDISKNCGHCDELLSYSAYRTHRTLYFNQSEQQWNREAETRSHDQASDRGQECSVSELNSDDYMKFSDELGLDEDDCSQTDSNTCTQ